MLVHGTVAKTMKSDSPNMDPVGRQGLNGTVLRTA